MPPEDPKSKKIATSNAFPDLPIISLDAPRMSQREKYGGLFYLGILGLVVVIGLVGWFAARAYQLRNVWNNVYILHDSSRTEGDRIEAARELSRDVRVNSQQRWDIALRKQLPAQARYLIAESFTTDLVTADPELFGKVVARSQGWPDWLKLLGVRIMAYASAEGTSFSGAILDEITGSGDPAITPWVDYIRAVSGEGDQAAAMRLRSQAAKSPADALENDLVGAIDGGTFERKRHLDSATAKLRRL